MAKKDRNRDKYVQVWVTEIEREVIRDKAKYCRLTISEYIRKVAIDGVIIKRDFKGLNEINKIGVNINQIAKKANESGVVIESYVDELRVQYEKLFELVYSQIING